MKKNLSRLLKVLIILSAAFILTACRKLELNIDDFVEFTDEGYDGIGTSKAEFDYKEALKEVKDKTKDERYSAAKKILKNVKLKPEAVEKVSNGQTVTFEWDIDEDDVKELEDECKLIVKFDDIEHKVKGLQELNEVDLFKDLSASFYGYDTYGTLSYLYGEGYVVYTAEKTEHLTNGEVIKVTAELDSWYKDSYTDLAAYMAQRGEKPKSLTGEIVVSGLYDLREYSPFQGLSLSCSGMNGEGTASLSHDWSNDYYYYWDYTLDKTEGLSNGDIVTVTASVSGDLPIDEYAGRNYGLKITEVQKEFTVEGLVVLAGSVADIDQDSLAELMINGKNSIVEMVGGWSGSGTKLVSIEKIGTALGYIQDYWYGTYTPNVYVIYRVLVHNETDGDVEFFWYVNCSNGELNDLGQVNIDPAYYDTPLNHYSSWWGLSGEAFYGPSNSLFYVGFASLDDLYLTKFENEGLLLKENTVEAGNDTMVLYLDGSDIDAGGEGTAPAEGGAGT